MQQLCGYTSAITGTKSPLCSIFTPSEWLANEYAFDLKYSYMVGPAEPAECASGVPVVERHGEVVWEVSLD